MAKNTEKMVAPIIITAVICAFILLYIAGIVAMCIWQPFTIPVMIILALILLAAAGVIIFVLVERIKEIRSGEEDDLSQY